jgi:hypothetical protein
MILTKTPPACSRRRRSEGAGQGRTRAQHGETRDQLRGDAEAPGSAKVSGLAETPDRRSPILGATPEAPGLANVSDLAETPDHRSPILEATADAPGSAKVSELAETPDRKSPLLESSAGLLSSATGQSDAGGESSSLNLFPLTVCDKDAFLRNEAMGAPDVPISGWGRHPEGNAPTSEAAAPGARWPSQLDPQPPKSCRRARC